MCSFKIPLLCFSVKIAAVGEAEVIMTGGHCGAEAPVPEVVSKLSDTDFKTLDKVQGFKQLGSKIKAVTTEVDQRKRQALLTKLLREIAHATLPGDSDCFFVKVERPPNGKLEAVAVKKKG